MKYIPDEGMKMIVECVGFQNNHLRKSAVKNAKELRNQRLKAEATKIKKKLISDVGKCEICGFNYKPILQVHHIVPISQYGNNQPENVMCVCPNCHKTLHHMYSVFLNGNSEGEIIKQTDIARGTFGASKQMLNVLTRYIVGKGAIIDYFKSIGLIDTSDE